MTDVAISALPVAASIADSDLVVVVEIGTPNVTKRATAAQMRAPLLPLTGGTISGALTLNSTLAVGGAATFTATATMDAGGGWSSANIGKQLLITTPTGTSVPGIGFTDVNGTNLFGIYNASGLFTIAGMPAYSDGVTAPTTVFTASKTLVTFPVAAKATSGFTVSAGGLTVSASGAAITGNSKITGTLETTSTLTVDAGGFAVTGNSKVTGTLETTGALTVDTGGLLVSAGGAAIAGTTVTDDLTVTTTAIIPAITGPTTITGTTTVASGALIVTGTALGTVTGAGQYDKSGVPVSPVTGGTTYSVNATGDVLGAIFYATSDKRAKTNIKAITADDAWAWLTVARPVTFAMNGSMSAGFIAQEDIANGRGVAVSFVEDEREPFAETDGVVPAGHRAIRNYEHDIAYLTAALQDALARIQALEAR